MAYRHESDRQRNALSVKLRFSMFILQVAMLSEFGGEDTGTEFWVDLGNGVLVCVAISLITTYQIVFSYRELVKTR